MAGWFLFRQLDSWIPDRILLTGLSSRCTGRLIVVPGLLTRVAGDEYLMDSLCFRIYWQGQDKPHQFKSTNMPSIHSLIF